MCEAKANPKLVDFTWMWNNTTLSKDIVHMGLQSILTIDGPPPPNGVYYCYVNNTVGLATPCEINVEGELFVCLFVFCPSCVTIRSQAKSASVSKVKTQEKCQLA